MLATILVVLVAVLASAFLLGVVGYTIYRTIYPGSLGELQEIMAESEALQGPDDLEFR